MSKVESEGAGRHDYFAEPTSTVAEVVRYALAAVVVAVGMGALVWLVQAAPSKEASEVDNAVFIDLPPTEASAAPAREATVGPEQQAAAATAAQRAPRPPEPPKELPKPVDQTRPPSPQQPVEEPPPPVAPDPDAILQRKSEQAPKPPAEPAAPPTPLQAKSAPLGVARPVKTKVRNAEEGRPHASKHAITLWQRALVQRLDRAKHLAYRQARASGTVKVGFIINASGALASERVVESSGSQSLDRTGLTIVRRAAPFPAPPFGSRKADLWFVIPIHFR